MLWAFSSQKVLQKKPFSVPKMKPDAFLGPKSRAPAFAQRKGFQMHTTLR